MHSGENNSKPKPFKAYLNRDQATFITTLLPRGYSVQGIKGRPPQNSSSVPLINTQNPYYSRNSAAQHYAKGSLRLYPGSQIKDTPSRPEFFLQCRSILEKISNHSDAHYLAISGDDRSVKIPHQSRVRLKPISLVQIQKQLKENKYPTKQSFVNDMHQLFLSNYSSTKRTSPKYQKIQEIQIIYLQQLDKLPEVEVKEEDQKSHISKVQHTRVKRANFHPPNSPYAEVQKDLLRIIKKLNDIPCKTEREHDVSNTPVIKRRKRNQAVSISDRKLLAEKVRNLDARTLRKAVQIILTRKQMAKTESSILNINFQTLEEAIVKKLKRLIEQSANTVPKFSISPQVKIYTMEEESKKFEGSQHIENYSVST